MSWQAIQGGKIADAFKTPVKNYQVTAGATDASVTLTRASWDERLLRLTANGADIRWNLNAAATATTYFLPQNQSIDIKLDFTSDDQTVHALRNASTSGILEITCFKEDT
tara:strand:- start:46 stop:375 length:330 start_codon:yes stop_codon:yes gene_type:complete